KLLVQMEKHVDSDLPFLTEERTVRLESLELVLYDPEITLGQKFRRMFEGLRAEMEYGRSVEVSKEEINYNGETFLVKMLRIGRTALLAQTLDEEECAIYSEGRWNTLPDDYREPISKAISIAEKKRPVEFVNLPVKAMRQ
ncbi:MAG: DUF3450 family protein, partial [Thermodesulfobacteriota bacterium]|nr:DUF3450 family protein [Thermodesulfobacteriota bacterium]